MAVADLGWERGTQPLPEVCLSPPPLLWRHTNFAPPCSATINVKICAVYFNTLLQRLEDFFHRPLPGFSPSTTQGDPHPPDPLTPHPHQGAVPPDFVGQNRLCSIGHYIKDSREKGVFVELQIHDPCIVVYTTQGPFGPK